MSKRRSSVTGNSGREKNIKQASASFKCAMVPRRVDISRAQNVLLIWLDNSIDEESNDYRNIVSQLRRIVNAVNTFTDRDQCIDFLTDIDTANICMIISDELGEHIIPLVHDVPQLDYIYIFCENKAYNQQWTKQWPKIKGVFTEIPSICEALDESAKQCEHNAIGVSFKSTTNGSSNTNLDQLECSFMYTQIMKEILLTIDFAQQHIKQFIDFCREVFADNSFKLNSVNEFERKYREETPIWWYACDSFLYPMLNRALRTMDVDIIIKMGFFIRDLHQQIKQMHSEQFSGHQSSQILTIYRGQSLFKEIFDQLTKTKGGLMSFNNFLSTSKDQDMALTYARKDLWNPDIMGILFIITIDPSISSTPFASINRVSCFQEDEMLFSMHTVFRIGEIKSMGENDRLWEVNLTLTSDNDKELCALTERMREEILPGAKGWYRLGMVLLKMGKSEKAQQVYEVMLEQTTDDQEKAAIYSQLGGAKSDQGEYRESLSFYEKSHEIYQKTFPSNHLTLATSYNNTSNVYSMMGEYSKALSSHEKALEIKKKALSPNHIDLATSYNNIGETYDKMSEYSKALSFYEQALEIFKKSLPSNHPHLAASYNNTGTAYDRVGEYTNALSYYEKALEIRQKILPPNHPDSAMSFGNIGLAFYNKGEYSKALSFLEKALEIRQKILSPNHPHLAASYSNIGSLYNNMGDYSRAFAYCREALEIFKKSLRSDHPHLAIYYDNMGFVHEKVGRYSNALSDYKIALEIKQKSLPSNHPDLALSYNNIGSVYENMGDYSKAFSCCKRAVDIGEQSLPSNHPHLHWYRKNLDLVKIDIVLFAYLSIKNQIF